MIRHSPLLFRLIVLSAIAVVATAAQELRATVTVNTEAIPSSARDYLRNFQSDVERYLNGTTFTGEDMLGDKIECSFDIFFRTAGAENRYVAQVFVGSQRPVYVNDEKSQQTSPILRILDERWEFEYQPGQRMRQDDFSFDMLTDFLDFYAYIIIGLDLETYTQGSGSQYFSKALGICDLGSSSESASEWRFQNAPYNRYAFAEELVNPRYTIFREAFASYHFDGVDLRSTQTAFALDNMLKAIESIAQVRKMLNPSSVAVRQFFNAKNREIADAFTAYADPNVYLKLGEYDQDHIAVYLEKRGR